MTRTTLVTLWMLLALLAATAAAAQPLGAFRWQLQPFCNVVTLNVTQNGAVYMLDGFDDQCGGSQRAPAVGIATGNPDGTIGIGLTIVSAPGGGPVHVAASLSLATVSGTWRDSAGNQGTFALTPGSGTGGSPRPTSGGLGLESIDTTQLQRRVTGECPPGQAMRVIDTSGAVVCGAAGGGDITGVSAGAGLTGGGTTGTVSLAVNLGYQVLHQAVTAAPISFFSVEAPCPSGRRAVGGGFRFTALASVVIRDSRPGDQGTGWLVAGFNGNSTPTEVVAVAVCLRVEPSQTTIGPTP